MRSNLPPDFRVFSGKNNGYGGILLIKPESIPIDTEILYPVAELDEFKGRWEPLGRLAPDVLDCQCGHYWGDRMKLRIKGVGEPMSIPRVVRCSLGIKRALEEWAEIDFTDDRKGCLFTATVHRKPVEEIEVTDKGAVKVQTKDRDASLNAPLSDYQVRLLVLIRSTPNISYEKMSELTQKDRTTVMRI